MNSETFVKIPSSIHNKSTSLFKNACTDGQNKKKEKKNYITPNTNYRR